MKLYRSHRLLTVIWCGAETLLFGGIIYGWGSLLYVLKEDGFYEDLCLDRRRKLNDLNDLKITNITNHNISFQAIDDGLLNVTATTHDTSYKYHDIAGKRTVKDCSEQGAQLTLWFSIAVAFMYISLAFLGPVISRLGTQITRHIFTVVFIAGSFCIAFATKDIPWLLCPGLCAIGLSGMVIFATNIQMSNLYPRFQSTIVACYCGLFDCSTVVQQIMKVLHSSGVSRQTFHICLGILAAVIVTISSILFLPKSYVTREKLQKRKNSQNEKFQSLLQIDKDSKEPESGKISSTDAVGFRGVQPYISSLTYVVHVVWMSVYVLLFVSFIGLLNANLIKISTDIRSEVSYYLGIFAYTTMTTVIAGVISGSIYDWQRKIFFSSHSTARKWRPAVLPMVITGLLSMSVYGLLLLGNIVVMIPIFILFTLFRSFLYSIGIAFINNAFPIQHFGFLYGLMTFINGVCSMAQYAFLNWFNSYETAHLHVNIVLMLLGAVGLIHPMMLWFRSRENNDNEQYNSVTIKL